MDGFRHTPLKILLFCVSLELALSQDSTTISSFKFPVVLFAAQIDGPLVAISDRNKIQVWNLDSGTLQADKGIDGFIDSLSFDSDSGHLIGLEGAEGGGTFLEWRFRDLNEQNKYDFSSFESKKEGVNLGGSDPEVTLIASSKNGRFFLIKQLNGDLFLWDRRAKTSLIKPFEGISPQNNDVALISDSGRVVIIPTTDGKVALIDCKTGKSTILKDIANVRGRIGTGKRGYTVLISEIGETIVIRREGQVEVIRLDPLSVVLEHKLDESIGDLPLEEVVRISPEGDYVALAKNKHFGIKIYSLKKNLPIEIRELQNVVLKRSAFLSGGKLVVQKSRLVLSKGTVTLHGDDYTYFVRPNGHTYVELPQTGQQRILYVDSLKPVENLLQYINDQKEKMIVPGENPLVFSGPDWFNKRTNVDSTYANHLFCFNLESQRLVWAFEVGLWTDYWQHDNITFGKVKSLKSLRERFVIQDESGSVSIWSESGERIAEFPPRSVGPSVEGKSQTGFSRAPRFIKPRFALAPEQGLLALCIESYTTSRLSLYHLTRESPLWTTEFSNGHPLDIAFSRDRKKVYVVQAEASWNSEISGGKSEMNSWNSWYEFDTITGKLSENQRRGDSIALEAFGDSVMLRQGRAVTLFGTQGEIEKIQLPMIATPGIRVAWPDRFFVDSSESFNLFTSGNLITFGYKGAEKKTKEVRDRDLGFSRCTVDGKDCWMFSLSGDSLTLPRIMLRHFDGSIDLKYYTSETPFYPFSGGLITTSKISRVLEGRKPQEPSEAEKRFLFSINPETPLDLFGVVKEISEKKIVALDDSKGMQLWDLSEKRFLGTLSFFEFASVNGTEQGELSWLWNDASGSFDTNYVRRINSLLNWSNMPGAMLVANKFRPGLFAMRLRGGEGSSTKAGVSEINSIPHVEIDTVEIDTSDNRMAIVKFLKAGTSNQQSKGTVKLIRDGYVVASKRVQGGSNRGSFATKIPARPMGEDISFKLRFIGDSGLVVDSKPSSVQSLNFSNQPRAYVVLIGIDSRQIGWLHGYAGGGASLVGNGIQKLLANAKGKQKLKEIQQVLLVSPKLNGEVQGALLPTKSNIEQTINRLHSLVNPDDIVFVYLCAHGVGIEDEFYFAPHDASFALDESDLLKIRDTLVSGEELSEWLGGLDSENMFMMIDTCNAFGSVSGKMHFMGPTHSRGLGLLAYEKRMPLLASSRPRESAHMQVIVNRFLQSVDEYLESGKSDTIPVALFKVLQATEKDLLEDSIRFDLQSKENGKIGKPIQVPRLFFQ